MLKRYSLRIAKQEGAEFLFNVILKAMMPVSSILRTEPFDYVKEFKEYLKKFEPEKVQIIMYKESDVGRLRVVRSAESIYVGGLQILPEFQKLGIGGAIFKDLMEESDRTHIPITTEIHHVNKINLEWKKKLGFKEVSRDDRKVTMRYN